MNNNEIIKTNTAVAKEYWLDFKSYGRKFSSINTNLLQDSQSIGMNVRQMDYRKFSQLLLNVSIVLNQTGNLIYQVDEAMQQADTEITKSTT